MAIAVGPEMAIRARSLAARGRYIETTEQAARSVSDGHEARALLTQSVVLLELFYISALTWEFAREHDVCSFAELRARSGDLDQYLTAAFPDLARVLPDLVVLVDELKPKDEPLSHDELFTTWNGGSWSGRFMP